MILAFLKYPQLDTSGGAVVDFTRVKIDKYIKMSISEQPKVLSFSILLRNFLDGTINPLLGIGPGNYLSGAAGKFGSELTDKFSSEGYLA